MMKQTDLNRVRQSVARHVGSKVRIRANKGRHKIDVTEGVIAETYPSIFLIEVQDDMDDTFKTMTFSYTDILTKDVRMTLCSNE